MQSQQNVIRHSRRGPTRRNTQRLPLLVGLFCASLTGCILEERNGSDAPDLRTLPDLRADLLPSPDLAAPCGDGIYVKGTGSNPGKCIYDYYQLSSGTCPSGKSITLYPPPTAFQQICSCACARTNMKISLMGSISCITWKDLPSDGACQNITAVNAVDASISGDCTLNSSISVASWKPDTPGLIYCLRTIDDHKKTPKPECIILDAQTPCFGEYINKTSLIVHPSVPADLTDCDCCNPNDYSKENPVIAYSNMGCSGLMSQISSSGGCSSFGPINAISAKWNPNFCPNSYLKIKSLTPGPTLTQVNLCCNQ
jgi:hypothetical protein